MATTSLVFDFVSNEDFSDSISTSAASLNFLPFEELSPEDPHSTDSLGDEVQSQSKKIRKKRNAYHKIDDDIRLKLLEAVQRGETLKSAAKRYQVNYSSAKSIFHIYRKEGRILKKATQEKPFGFNSPDQQLDIAVRSHLLSDRNSTHTGYTSSLNNYSTFKQPFQQDFKHHSVSISDAAGCSSPLNELADNFVDLLKIGANMKPREDLVKPQSFTPRNTGFVTRQIMQRESPIHRMIPGYQMTLSSNPNTSLFSPNKRLKPFGDFIMNYSNSPLSNRMLKEGSESGSNKCVQGEFDSFSDMLTAFQGNPHLTESLKRETPASRFKLHSLNSKTDEELINNLENPVLGTFKSFVDMQMTLTNPFKNFTYNMVQKPLIDESPFNNSFKCN